MAPIATTKQSMADSTAEQVASLKVEDALVNEQEEEDDDEEGDEQVEGEGGGAAGGAS
jgi:hypothetical protein